MCNYLISLFLHRHRSAYFRKPSTQLWRHNMAFMLTQQWGELKVCDSLRNRCEEHYDSKEESNLYSKSWPLHDPKTNQGNTLLKRVSDSGETAYLPIGPSALWTEYCERETAPRATEKWYFILCVLSLSFHVIFLATRSLSLDTRNSPNVAMYRARRLWHTLWSEITYSVLCLRKLRKKKISELQNFKILFPAMQGLWVVNSSHWKGAWGVLYFKYMNYYSQFFKKAKTNFIKAQLDQDFQADQQFQVSQLDIPSLSSQTGCSSGKSSKEASSCIIKMLMQPKLLKIWA